MIEIPLLENQDGSEYTPYRYGTNCLLITANVIPRAFQGLLARAEAMPSVEQCEKIRYSSFDVAGNDILSSEAPVAEFITEEEHAAIQAGLEYLKKISTCEDPLMSEPLAARSFHLPSWPQDKDLFRRCRDHVTGKDRLVILWGLFKKHPMGRVLEGAGPDIAPGMLHTVIPPVVKSDGCTSDSPPPFAPPQGGSRLPPLPNVGPLNPAPSASSQFPTWLFVLLLLAGVAILVLFLWPRGTHREVVTETVTAYGAARIDVPSVIGPKGEADYGMPAADTALSGVSNNALEGEASKGPLAANTGLSSAPGRVTGSGKHSASKSNIPDVAGSSLPESGADRVLPLQKDSVSSGPRNTRPAADETLTQDPEAGKDSVLPSAERNKAGPQGKGQLSNIAGKGDKLSAAELGGIPLGSQDLRYKWEKLEGPEGIQSPWFGMYPPPLRDSGAQKDVVKVRFRNIVSASDDTVLIDQEVVWVYKAYGVESKGVVK
jgi:hypothetical protein